MNSKKVAETIQQDREWARAEYEAKTKGLRFTKDFQTRQEAVMRDPLATVGERVMAWILRWSWGEYVLYAIRDDGEPAYQRDCARQLGIDKKQVSNAVAYYQKRGYLENHPKKLYPVISPVLGGPPQKSKKSQEFVTFLEEWKVTHSSDFEAREVARSTIKKIDKVLLSDYKKWKQQRQKAPASLLEIKRVKREPQTAAASKVRAAAADAPPQTHSESKSDVDLVARELNTTREAAAPIVAGCRKNLPSVTGPEMAELCRRKARKKGIENPIGLLTKYPPEAHELLALRKEQQSQQEALARQRIADVEQIRQLWDGYDEEHRAALLAKYPELLE